MSNAITNMFIGDIRTASPFRELFPIDEKVLDAIYWDLQKHGFDPAKPLILWESHGSIVIDGHTRLRAAHKAGLCQVPVLLKYFADEGEALQYAISSQRNRRNLTAREILACITELDSRRKAGRPGKLAQECASSGKSAQATADLLGISARKVEQARTILTKAPEEIKSAVNSGNMSIHAAYHKTMKHPPQPTPLPLAEDEQKKLSELVALVEDELDTRLLREFIKLLAEKILKNSSKSK